MPPFTITEKSSCSTYPKNWVLNLRLEESIVNTTWKIVHYKKNGLDITSMFSGIDYLENYNADGTYSYSSRLGGGTGTWEFLDDKKKIKRLAVSRQYTETLCILKLEKKYFSYIFMDGNDKHEVHLKEN